tara:strand:+ start:10701 stop:11624 length:924 start_codon:yes stop_codon:yes gene_type:complete
MGLLKQKHLIGLKDISKEDIELILKHAFSFREILDRPIKKVPTLNGKTIANLFFENSTRTKMSFELAERRLSADTINFAKNTSSINKGESLKDTIKNIETMKIDCIVIRHNASGCCYHIKEYVDCVIINAGDGMFEHPTQALLDIMSIKEKKGSIKNLNIGIVGDIYHSRTARSNIFGLTKLGANVMLCGPANLVPEDMKEFGVKINYNIDEVLEWADVVNVLRIQKERFNSNFLPSSREYRNAFGITKERLKKIKKEIIIMHPGPTNIGVEIDNYVVESDQSIILDQVLNGVAIRMSVLYLLLSSK